MNRLIIIILGFLIGQSITTCVRTSSNSIRIDRSLKVTDSLFWEISKVAEHALFERDSLRKQLKKIK